jgi:hypothetical protein
LEQHLKGAETYQPPADMLQEQWKGFVWPCSAEANRNPETGVDIETLKDVGKTSVKLPEGFVCTVCEQAPLSNNDPNPFIIGNSPKTAKACEAPSQ